MQRQALSDGDKILLGSTTILKFSYHDKLDEMFQRQMSESALRDGLTKAFNKRYFSDRLESELTFAPATGRRWRCCSSTSITSRRSTTPTATRRRLRAHASSSKLITGTLRAEDVFARYGGEEFAIISRGTDGHRRRDHGRAPAQAWSRPTRSRTRASRSA